MVSFSVRSFLKSWLPVLAWMIFIFIGSTDLLSAAHTSRFIGPFLRWFSPGISDVTIASVQLIVRKCGHLTEYSILAALLCRALRGSRWWLAFLIAAAYAGLDEFHQSFVTSRTGTPSDVLVDCIGALIGAAICRLGQPKKPFLSSRRSEDRLQNNPDSSTSRRSRRIVATEASPRADRRPPSSC